MIEAWPAFRTPRWLRSGHLQTLAGAWWLVDRGALSGTQRHTVVLDDGDQLILHDDAPAHWETGGPAVLLVHGLAGCHASGYMIRIARRLVEAGLRCFRLDLRGCGAGRDLAVHPYHAGRWPDLEAAAQLIQQVSPGSPLSVVGFSLGGNMVLRWLGESAWASAELHRAMAVNPPADLAVSTEQIARSVGGMYDRHFARLLFRQLRGSRQWRPDSPLARAGRAPRRLIEFDDLYTAPLSGFDNAAHYYSQASAAPLVSRITVPTLILSAVDDPLIPHEMLTALERSPEVQLRMERHGGHLGYIAANGADPDRHWMDWRVVDWMLAASGRRDVCKP